MSEALEFARLVAENLEALHRDPEDPAASVDYARSRARQLVELLEAEERPTCTVCGCTSATSSLRAGTLIREWFGGPVCFDCFSEWYDGGEPARDQEVLRERVLAKREPPMPCDPRTIPDGPTPVSDILTDVPPDWTTDAAEAVRRGVTEAKYEPHPGCWCERCHRWYGTIP